MKTETQKQKIELDLLKINGLVFTTLLILLLLLTSCIPYHKREKPFIVVFKEPCPNYIKYKYEDVSGKEFYFYETFDRYNIGDTIK